MDVKFFSYFECLCRHRGYAAAAEELGMTPQGLMSAVRRASDEVGEELVTTRHGMVEPTSYGALFTQLSGDVLESVADFKRAVATTRSHERGLVRVGFIIGSLGYFGEGLFDEFNKANDDVQVYLTAELPDDDLQEALLAGDYDFGVMINVSSEQLVRLHVASDYSFLWVREDDSLASRAMLDLPDIDGRTVYAVRYEFGGGSPVIRAFTDARARVDLRDVGEMMRVFERVYAGGHALGFTARHHVEATRGTGVVGIPFARLPFDYYLCYRRDRPLSEGDRKLIDYMKSKKRMYR